MVDNRSSDKHGSVLERSWYSDNWLAYLLIPLSWLFAAVSQLRRRILQRTASRQELPVPVIVVGNISVGGTGKTPLLITLVTELQKSGFRPGVISRGYGARAPQYPMLVTGQTPPQEGGDEPVLIAAQCRCPVVVDPDRLQAAHYLITHTDCNVILSDDGLQHYRLPRDIEIAVIDGHRGFGNGRLLPAGPLREPLPRLKQVDFVLSNGEPEGALFTPLQDTEVIVMNVDAQAELRSVAGERRILARDWPFNRRNIHAVAGIGNPQRFTNTLSSLGFVAELHAFPDHHVFTAADLTFDDEKGIIMTAKDAVKCRQLVSPEADCWALDVVANVPREWLDKLFLKLNSIS